MARIVHKASGRTLFAFALGLLLLCGNLAGSLHLVTIRHVACAAHGELVHAADDHAAGVPDTEEGPQLTGSEPRRAADHEHCSIALGLRERAVVWDVTPLPAHGGGLEVDRALGPPGTPIRTQPRYRLAPKQSPPA